MQVIQEWINRTLESPTLGVAVLAASFALGVSSVILGAACSLPAWGMIVGCGGAVGEGGRSRAIKGAVFFTLGSAVGLIIFGIIAAFVGQVAQATLGRYWKLFAGMVAILFGLGALGMLPFRLPSISSAGPVKPKGLWGMVVLGVVMGGVVGVSSLCCNPGFFVIVGAVLLKGYSPLSMTMLTAYAVGFSLPLGAIMLGISFGKTVAKARAVSSVIRIVAGGMLMAVGFYFLATI